MAAVLESWFASLVNRIADHAKVLGGFAIVAIGVMDGVVYYNSFGIPFLEYADWVDFARVGVFGGLFALALTALVAFGALLAVVILSFVIAFGVPALVAIAAEFPVRVVGEVASLFDALSGTLLDRVQQLSNWTRPSDTARVWREGMWAEFRRVAGRYGHYAVFAVWALFAILYIVVHHQRAENDLERVRAAAGDPPVCGVGKVSDASWNGLLLWLASLRSPNVCQPLNVRTSERSVLGTHALGFVGKLGAHYLFVRLDATAAPVAVLVSRIQSIEPYGVASVGLPPPIVDTSGPVAESVDNFDDGVTLIAAQIAKIAGKDTVVNVTTPAPIVNVTTPAPIVNVMNAVGREERGFAVYFEEERQRELSELSKELLGSVGLSLQQCLDATGAPTMTLVVEGDVSSAGIPDSERDTSHSKQAQVSLANDRALAIKRYFDADFKEPRILVAVRWLGGSQYDRAIGPVDDRPSGSYQTRLGLFNRRAWVTVGLEQIESCPLRKGA